MARKSLPVDPAQLAPEDVETNARVALGQCACGVWRQFAAQFAVPPAWVPVLEGERARVLHMLEAFPAYPLKGPFTDTRTMQEETVTPSEVDLAGPVDFNREDQGIDFARAPGGEWSADLKSEMGEACAQQDFYEILRGGLLQDLPEHMAILTGEWQDLLANPDVLANPGEWSSGDLHVGFRKPGDPDPVNWYRVAVEELEDDYEDFQDAIEAGKRITRPGAGLGPEDWEAF